MVVDTLVVLLFVLLSWLGWRAGALSQALRLGAAVAAFVFAPLAAEIVREAVFGVPSASDDPVLAVASLAIAAFALYALITLVGVLLIKAGHALSTTLRTTDRLAGASLGALKALVLIYFGLVCLALLQVPLARIDPDDRLHLRDGAAFRLASTDPLIAPWSFPSLRHLHAALRVGDRIQRQSQQDWLREHHPTVADLLRHASLEALLQDRDLVEAAHRDLYPRTLASLSVRRLLSDRELRQELSAIDWRAVEASLPEASMVP